MQVILNNPYRIGGLLVSTPHKEWNPGFDRLKKIMASEDTMPDDFNFPVLGPQNRTLTAIAGAESKLDRDQAKVNAALFWFYDGNSGFDENAFNCLKAGNKQDAIAVWTALTGVSELTKSNCSAFFNLSTLLLCAAFEEVPVNKRLLEKGIALKLKFMESLVLEGLIRLVTDETFIITKMAVQLYFLKQVQQEAVKKNGLTIFEFMDILGDLVCEAKDAFLKEIVKAHTLLIERKIEEVKTEHQTAAGNALKAGDDLFRETVDSLALLKFISGYSNIKYVSVADSVSKEILACCLEYFHQYAPCGPGELITMLHLCIKAEGVAVGRETKLHCRENITALQKLIALVHASERLRRLFPVPVDKYSVAWATVARARELLKKSTPYLTMLKKAAEDDSQKYLAWSSDLGDAALVFCISEINKLRRQLKYPKDRSEKLMISSFLNKRLKEAVEITRQVGLMDLKEEIRIKYKKDLKLLSRLRTKRAIGNFFLITINPLAKLYS